MRKFLSNVIFIFFPFYTIFANCPFCDVEMSQCITETEHFYVLYCLTPATEGNLLLIPKRHFLRFEELNLEEGAELFSLIKKTQRVFQQKYAIADYLLLQKNGEDAGQSVSHIHVHILPCPKGMDLTRVFKHRETLNPEEMQEKIEELRPLFTS